MTQMWRRISDKMTTCVTNDYVKDNVRRHVYVLKTNSGLHSNPHARTHMPPMVDRVAAA